jgi:enoyl-CoA hydratase
MTDNETMARPGESAEPVVLYERRGATAVITMNRPKYRNAQNSVMSYALDAAFERAVDDNDVRVVVLAAAGEHFSAGHDIGTPGRDVHVRYDRRAVIWWGHTDKAGADARYAREMEVYLGMCRRWREIPKPMIAKVQGACIAGGLMLAWVCDLIVASDDAFFADPVVRMGIPGVEYFAHEKFGVASYWIFDPNPERPELTVFELLKGSYQQIAQASGSNAPRIERPFPVELIPARLTLEPRR